MPVSVVERCLLDLIAVEVIDELSVGNLGAGGRRGKELQSDGPNDDREQHEDCPAWPSVVTPESAAFSVFARTGRGRGSVGTHGWQPRARLGKSSSRPASA